MGIESRDQPDNVSLAWLRRYDFSSEDMTLHRMNPDIHPPFKGTASRCALASSPIRGDCVWGICEVGKGAEGEFGEVNG